MRVDYYRLKVGQCFRVRKNGPIYQNNDVGDSQCLTGKNAGRIKYFEDKKVYLVEVKIVVE